MHACTAVGHNSNVGVSMAVAAAVTGGAGAGGAIRGFRESTRGAAVRLSASAAASFHDVAFEDISLVVKLSSQSNGPIAALRRDAFANFTGCNFTNINAAVRPPPSAPAALRSGPFQNRCRRSVACEQ